MKCNVVGRLVVTTMKWFVSLILLNTFNVSAAQWSAFPGRFNCPDVLNSNECARKIEDSLRVEFIRRINDADLTLNLVGGALKTFAEEGVWHSVLEVTPTGRYAILHRQYSEGAGFGLLDRVTGQYWKFGGYPVFSPNAKWLVVANTDLDASFSETVFQFYRVSAGEIAFYQGIEVGEWGPEQVRWISDSEIAFVEATNSCMAFNGTPCEHRSLQFIDAQWQ